MNRAHPLHVCRRINPSNASSSTVLQRPETHRQESESSALTFMSNHACRGLQRQAPIDENPVAHSNMPTATGLVDCLLSSRSLVRIQQGAFQKTKPGQALSENTEMLETTYCIKSLLRLQTNLQR